MNDYIEVILSVGIFIETIVMFGVFYAVDVYALTINKKFILALIGLESAGFAAWAIYELAQLGQGA